MKIRIKKGLRKIMLLSTAGLLCILALVLSSELAAGEVSEEKISLYEYRQKAEIDYEVFLSPNILYDEESLGKGGTYIASYIDRIDATMVYNFIGERNAEYRGEYEIIAEVEGYKTQDDAYKTIWKKDFVLMDKTQFEGSGRSIEIKEEVPIELSIYGNYANSIKEETGIMSSVKLTILWRVSLNAETDSGTVVENAVPFAVIPLGEKYFEITGQLDLEKTGSIDEVRQVAVPPEKGLVNAYGMGIGISAIALIFILAFTKSGDVDPIEIRLRRIFKKHGARLAALSGEVKVDEKRCSVVKSIDDLVRIADELGRPITYRYSDDFKETRRFYVFDEIKTYMYDINLEVVEDKGQKKKAIGK